MASVANPSAPTPRGRSGGRVFVTRRIPSAGLAVLDTADVDVLVGQTDDECSLPREALLEGVRGADVLLSLLTEQVDRELLQAASGLRGVANYAVGFDNVDLEAATELGVPVSNTPGVLTDTTADFTWALLLAAARRISEADAYTKAGRYRIWGPNLLLGADVSPGGSERRKVLGVVGFGRIGRAVARRAVGFEMEVIAYDPLGREAVEGSGLASWAELDDLLARSDFVSLHPALTPETHHLIGAAELERMKPTAILVNAARGPVVDEAALVVALREGWIGGAGLDVFENEPALAPGLAELSNVVIAPHAASASRDTRDRMAVMAATDALRHLRGDRAEHPVNPEVYESDAYRERVAIRA